MTSFFGRLVSGHVHIIEHRPFGKIKRWFIPKGVYSGLYCFLHLSIVHLKLQLLQKKDNISGISKNGQIVETDCLTSVN